MAETQQRMLSLEVAEGATPEIATRDHVNVI